MKKNIAALLCTLLIVTACITVGRNFPSEKVTGILIGTSTKEDIRSMFGKPYQYGLEDGRETWTYVWIRHGVKSASKELHLKFLDNGVVSSYSFSGSNPEEIRQ